MGGPWPRIRRVPVAGITGHSLVDASSGIDMNVARRAVRIRTRAVNHATLRIVVQVIREFRMKGIEKRDRIVQRNLADHRITPPFVTLHGGHLVAPLEHGMGGVPLPYLIRMNDECIAVPKADRLAHPTWELFVLRRVADAGVNPTDLS